MGSAEDLYKRLADDPGSFKRRRSGCQPHVGDLGIEGVMVVTVLLDRLTTRVDQLESEIKKLKREAKKRRA